MVATNPSPPTNIGCYNILAESVEVIFQDGAANGSPINSRQIAYSFYPSTPAQNGTTYPIVASDGSTTIHGLIPATTYYFWARTHNAVGYSAWSVRAQAYIPTAPDAPSTPWVYDVQPTQLTVGWSPNGDGGSPIVEYQLGWGTDPDTPQNVWTENSPAIISALAPGTVYYFAVRARNAIGWGPYSGNVSTRTVAGVRVNDNGTWRLALPYVKDGGTWRLAQPWVKESGVWRRTT
jgi:hypothetical protein